VCVARYRCDDDSLGVWPRRGCSISVFPQFRRLAVKDYPAQQVWCKHLCLVCQPVCLTPLS